MFSVVMGQDGDDYEAAAVPNLLQALESANHFARQINQRAISQSTTYIYILTPDGQRINYPYQTLIA